MTREPDILYLHPTKLLSNTEFSLIPLGLIGMLNLLIKKGYKVLGINNGIEKFLNSEYDMAIDLQNVDYQVLLIDLHWFEHSFGAIHTAKIAKSLKPQKPVIIGGITSTIFAEEIMKRFSVIDYIVKGDSEKPLTMLIDQILNQKGSLDNIPNLCFRQGDRVVNKKIAYLCSHIDGFDYTTVDFLKNKRFFYYLQKSSIDLNMKSATLYLARGCKYNCSFCSGSNQNATAFYGKRDRFTFRTIQSVADDMVKLTGKGIRLFYPSHGFEMFAESYYRDLFSLIRSKKLDAGMSIPCCQLPSAGSLTDLKHTLNPDLTQVVLAPYTGDESIRVLNGRKFNNEDLMNLLKFMAKKKIRVRLLYAQNVNYEETDSFGKTLRQIEKIAAFYPGQLLTVACERIFLDPLAPYRNNIKSGMKSFMNYYDYCQKEDDAELDYTGLSQKQLDERWTQFTEVREKLGISQF